MRQLLATLCVTLSLALIALGSAYSTGGYCLRTLSNSRPTAIVGPILDTVVVSHAVVSEYNQACPSLLWHLVDENTYKDERRVQERGTRDESSLAALCSPRRVEMHHSFPGIVWLEIKGRLLPLESWAC
jgi:hypothetical protein